MQLFGQNIRKVNRQDVNGKTFQIHLKQVISRFLELFDHLEKVLEKSEKCLPCDPWSLEGHLREDLNNLVKMTKK